MDIVQWIERAAFKRGLTRPAFFRNVVRRAAYAMAGGDPERVHELALEALTAYEDAIREVANQFHDLSLQVILNGRNVMPFGTAAGLDKNADAIHPLSYLFGFEEVGTVIVNPREGNQRPRVAVDEQHDELYNAQGFPSKGLDHVLANVQKHHAAADKGPALMYFSVCGIPPDEHGLDVAYQELELLVDQLGPYADGFVWNPFSPNTAALKALRNPEAFKRSAELIARRAGPKLKLVKMGPYEDNEEQRQGWLELAAAWLGGGGDGLVAVNTLMVKKEDVPSNEWGYPSAGRSGTFLQPYRDRAISDARTAFPGAVIIGTGGINSAEQAWSALNAGADALEGYTPYTFSGFGLLLDMAAGIKTRLKEAGYDTLAAFQKSLRQ